MNAYPQFNDPEIDKFEAIARAGNMARLARILGVSRSTVLEWKTIPLHQAYRLAQIFPELVKK